MRQWVSKWLIHFLNWGSLLLLLGYAAAVFDILPERIPLHFDVTGRPDAWTELSMENWLFFPLLAFICCALLYIFGLLVPSLRRRPEILIVPFKRRFLELTDKQRAPVFKLVAGAVFQVILPTNLLFFWIQRETFKVNLGAKQSRMIWEALGVWAIVVAVIWILFSMRFFAAIRKAVGVSDEEYEPEAE